MRFLVVVLALFGALAPVAAFAFDRDEKIAALNRIAQLIEDNYVYADEAAAIARGMRGWHDDPDFLASDSELIFASMLSERLKQKDSHFSITWSHPAAEDGEAAASPASHEGHDDFGRVSNYGFEAAERLDGNIGYLRLSYFADFDHLAAETAPERRTAEAAMAFLEGTDAMIVDVRQNGGGSPVMVHLLFSHFVDAKPMLINSFYERQGDQKVDYYSFDTIANKRRPATPLFVLTSGRTASAAEEFSYDVKTHGRGVVVGETTAGAANPGDTFDAGGGFSIFISTGAAVNPVTGTNWESVGVQPDVAITADGALARAYELALEAVIADHDHTEMEKREAQWTLERMRAQATNPPMKQSALRRYAGKYADREIVVNGGALAYKRDRRPALTLVPLTGDLFAFAELATVRVKFERNGQGEIVAMSLLDVTGSESRYQRAAN